MARGIGEEGHPEANGLAFLDFRAKARAWGEEARRRLSGQIQIFLVLLLRRGPVAGETRSSDEWARFLSAFREESEERIELVFHAGENERGFEATGASHYQR
jgi:hypothetical protein